MTELKIPSLNLFNNQQPLRESNLIKNANKKTNQFDIIR
jgi:hypothetical protein